MEISDRRYEELLALIRSRERGSEYAQSRAGAMNEGRAKLAVIHWGRIGANRVEYLQADSVPVPTNVAPAVKTVLVVDPDVGVRRELQYGLRLVADVEACSGFLVARARLFAKPPDLLVTNLRLQAYNGLHLVYLAAGEPTRCVVYATYDDLVLAREAQATGAFYERSKRLTCTLPSYLSGVLPARDRRALTVPDPLQPFPNGQRCTDR